MSEAPAFSRMRKEKPRRAILQRGTQNTASAPRKTTKAG